MLKANNASQKANSNVVSENSSSNIALPAASTSISVSPGVSSPSPTVPTSISSSPVASSPSPVPNLLGPDSGYFPGTIMLINKIHAISAMEIAEERRLKQIKTNKFKN